MLKRIKKMLGYHGQHCPLCHKQLHKRTKLVHNVRVGKLHYRFVCKACADGVGAVKL